MSPEILLILPPYIIGGESGAGIDARSTTPPIGLLYLASVLRNSGYSVEILDMNCDQIQTEAGLAKYIKGRKPEVIGISSVTEKFQNAADMAKICKRKFQDIPILTGGCCATFNHDKIMANYADVDFVIRREGEETIVELVRECEKRKPKFSKIRGLSYRENGRVKVNKDRPMISDLDSIPFPSYDLVSHIKYGSFGSMRVTSGNIIPILSSRGCSYKCSFCVCSAIANNTTRLRSPENVLDELRYFSEKFGLREFLFVDDNFTFDSKRVIEICRLIKENKLDIEWYAEGRVNQADELMFREMASAGCKIIYFGIESFTKKILEYYRKGTNFDMATNAVEKARRADLDTVGSFIFGAPIETVDEMWDTVTNAAKLDLDFAHFNILSLARGIPIWNELARQGLIDEEKSWNEVKLGVEFNPDVTPEEMNKLIKKFNRHFYLRKSYLLRQIARTLMYRRKYLYLNLNQLGKLSSELKKTINI